MLVCAVLWHLCIHHCTMAPLFFGFVEVFGLLLLEKSRREEVISSRGSNKLSNLSAWTFLLLFFFIYFETFFA